VPEPPARIMPFIILVMLKNGILFDMFVVRLEGRKQKTKEKENFYLVFPSAFNLQPISFLYYNKYVLRIKLQNWINI